ncbi:MAG: hypothetical protein IJ439_01175 [Tyzzerella sp.]|nr:hypothetical protein [Tyzzerella sp.]
MKRLYQEYFHIPEDGKIREKVFISRVVVAVVGILVWMSAMGFTAYAYFTCSVTSGKNTITSAMYALDITAPEGVPEGSGSYTLDNSKGAENKDYQFVLKKSDSATASVGYCKIQVIGEKEEIFYTGPIGSVKESDGSVKEIKDRTITISIPNGKCASVKFIAEWGTCSQETINENKNKVNPSFSMTQNASDISTQSLDEVPKSTNSLEGTSGSKTTDETVNVQTDTTTNTQTTSGEDVIENDENSQDTGNTKISGSTGENAGNEDDTTVSDDNKTESE